MFEVNCMSIKYLISKSLISYVYLKNKETLVLIYFLFFILGVSNSNGYNFYNEYRVIEVAILLLLGLWTVLKGEHQFNKIELLFFAFIAVGSVFWQHSLFIIIDLLLTYLLVKSFQLLNYNELITKVIVLSSLVIFLLLPVTLLDYFTSGTYIPNWYPLSWNIRIYNSYFLILSIFATWFYINGERYKNIYLLFLFLAFFAVLLDGGRSVTLAYTSFVIIIAICHKTTRLPLILTYISSWLAYLAITYAASFGNDGLSIVRESSSGRIDLWVNGLQCWVTRPILGCGFYQLEQFPQLSAHPHNIFIQVLTETGLVGFGFLAFIGFKVVRHISWNIKENYFVIAALFAVIIDMSLSGVHIYPVTQMALLWLFVFLLKNSAFAHANYFSQTTKSRGFIEKYLSVFILLVLVIIFYYTFAHTDIFLKDMPATPPRFWGYGYHIL